jgi:DNA repair exonuclease SbcCD nuclease subunit
MKIRILFCIATCVAVFNLPVRCAAQVVVAQISDTHLGEPRAPHAAENLRKTVEMVNARHPDAVILSGDIGENPKAWDEAKAILKGLKARLYYAPGNHDVHSHDVDRYRGAFGKDYYRFEVKNVSFVVIDSQLLGNFDQYEAKSPPPLPPETEAESKRMLSWLEDQSLHKSGGIVIGVQHIPVFTDNGFPDPHPYWVVNEPYRGRELDLLHKLGIQHMLVGHWHNGRGFEQDGISWHVAPATSWLPWGGELGFAMHTISSGGDVKTEFVALPGAQP